MGRWIALVSVSLSTLALAQECVPVCRSGYLCHDGQCVSRCNPPCPAGSTCLDTGECEVAPAAPSAPSATPVGPRVNRGWATGAGVIGAVSAGVMVLLTGITIAINGTDAANYSGAVATLFAGVSVPIVAIGAGSSRWDPQIRGSPPWRITGWIAYGLTMADAIIALGIGIAGATVPSYVIASIGLLGVLSAVSHMLDAFATASQARALATAQVAPPVTQGPTLMVARDATGALLPALGWHVSF